MIKTLREFVRKINNLFILLILILVYYPGVGICFLVLKIVEAMNKKDVNTDSYWKDSELGKFDKKYFSSAY